MTAPHRRIRFLFAALVIVAVVILVFQWDARRRVDHLQDMMESQGRAIADLVAEASQHGLATFDSWRDEVEHRLVNNALWLAWLDAEGGLDRERLRGFAATMGLHRILVFGPDGRLEGASHDPPGGGGAGDLRLPAGFLAPLLDGREPFRVHGFRDAARPGEQRLVAGSARPGGGAIVVNVTADSLHATRRDLGPGHLIRSLGEGPAFRYIVIQDRTGIQAASTADLDYPLTLDAPFLAPLEEGARWVSREYESAAGVVFEVSRKVALGAQPVWLRVGLDGQLLADMRADTRRQAVMRLAVLLGGLALVSALTWAWQRQGHLDSEVARISAELQRHEVEARRREKLVAMGSLGAGVAHQIRNPLNSIHMLAQVLGRRADLPDDVRQQVTHVRDESARIEQIVRQFLQFAKPREPICEELDLAAVVREVTDLQAAAAGPGGPTFSAYAPGLTAEVDRQFVIEILENLLRNAAAAVGPGGKVLVSLIGAGDMAEIVVADDGPGVPAADRDRIFDLYYTTRPEGTGLGLSLAAQMVAAMDGSLELDTEPGLDGRGARFVVRLPRHRGGGERKDTET
ncbi:HAMP domain-containing histidine kinase [bacterium]|nr:HAMP domain-containing histidine kinase [bacterium]